MHSSSKKLLALYAAASLSCTALASPLQPSATYSSSPSLKTNAVNCNDVSTGLAPACWFALNMTTYLNYWVATSPYGNNISADGTPGSTNSSTATTTNTTSSTSDNPFADDDVTTGSSSSDYFRKRIVARAAAAPASGQCQGGKPFSTCFLQLQPGYVYGKSNCSRINTGGVNGTCPPPRAADYSNDPQGFYAAWNFYSINAYISTFHLALTTLAHSSPAILSTAATQAAPGISYFYSAGQTLPIDTPLLDLLIRSTGGHELPGAQNTPLLTLLGVNPSAVTYGEATPPTQLASLMQGRLEQVLGEIMADERVFVGVAGNGAFSTRESLSVEGLVKVLGG